MTVADLIDSYVEKHARPNMRSHAELERRLRKNVEPIIGNMRLADLHRRDIARVVDPVMRRGKPVEACRVFEDTRRCCGGRSRAATSTGIRCEGMRRPAEADATRPGAFRRRGAHVLACAAEGAGASRPFSASSSSALSPASASAKSAAWSAPNWTSRRRCGRLPPLRTKNGIEHTVPLSALAVEIIREALADAPADSPFVFPGRQRRHVRDGGG